MPALCSACGWQNPEGSQFCNQCGARCSGAPHWLPSDELRLVTVLFADLVGFTALSEDRSPEDVTVLMNRCFQALGEQIARYEGSVDSYAGDSLMARFGAPVAHEDDAERAILAAQGMLQALAELSAGLERGPGEPLLRMRIGINTGEALAGAVGMVGYRTYTVMGDTVNVAARLQAVAPVNGVLVGERTYQLSRHAFDFRPLPPLLLKGKREPVRVYEPLGRRLDMADRRSLFEGAEPPFVGRAPELASLRASLDRARQGQGQVVSLRGDAGVGKTRLTLELRKQMWEQAPEVRWAYARSASYGADAPYAVLRQVLNDLLGVRSRETRSEARWRVAERIGGLFPDPDEAQAVCALLGDALGLSFPLPWVDQLEPQHRRRLFLERVEVLAARLAAEAPLAIVVDDAQWMDEASGEVLTHLAGRLGALPVWLAYLMRTDDSVTAPALPAAHTLTLEELGDVERAALMEALLEGRAAVGGVRSAILEKTGGNPFFIEEVVRTLAEQGALESGEAGQRAPDLSAHIPATVQGVVLARLDRLDEGARRVLQVASVIGRAAPAPLLGAVIPLELSAPGAGASRSGVGEALETLRRQGYVAVTGARGQEEVRFSHGIIQEVAYNALPLARRRELHGKVAELLRARDSSPDQTEVLAFHYSHSDDHLQASHYLREAGVRANRRFLNREALAAYGEALSHLDRASQPEAEAAERRVALLSGIAEVLGRIGRTAEALTAYRGALAAAPQPAQRGAVALMMASLLNRAEQLQEALEVLESAEGELEAPGAPLDHRLVRGQLRARAGSMHHRLGHLQQALSLARSGLSLVRDAAEEAAAAGRPAAAGEREESEAAAAERAVGMVENIVATCYYGSDYYGLAITHYLEVLRLAEARQDVALAATVHGNLGYANHAHGHLAQAEEHFRRALSLTTQMGYRWGAAHNLYGLGRVLAARGEPAEAAAIFRESLAMRRELGDRGWSARTLLELAGIAIEEGNLAQADAYYREGQELAQGSSLGWTPIALALTGGRLALAAGDSAGARRSFEEAQQLGRDRGYRDAQCMAALDLAVTAWRSGDLAAARIHAEEAISLAEATERRLERGLARALLAEVIRSQTGAKDSVSTMLFRRAMDDLEAAGARLAAERTAALWRDPAREALPPRR